ncbi:unnamed protein product [Rotaria sordida]|uniref:Uncharacterized protein n=1 Tax=Rotaria sordida TaxID=392033 RepID=A0A819W4Q8_9BILA|nr:unnamed protein product [Rotaria sordida]
MIPIIFTYILTTFKNLQYLKFGSSSISYPRLSFYITRPFIISLNLLELYINLEYFTNYLYLSKIGQCHIYTYPYQLEYYDMITNNFLDGIFKCVRKILLFDEYPFEHEFIFQISKSFPFLEKLTIINRKR